MPRRACPSPSTTIISPHRPVIGDSRRSRAARRLSIHAPRQARQTIHAISTTNTYRAASAVNSYASLLIARLPSFKPKSFNKNPILL